MIIRVKWEFRQFLDASSGSSRGLPDCDAVLHVASGTCRVQPPCAQPSRARGEGSWDQLSEKTARGE